MATWNVRTLYASGKLEQLQNKMGDHDYKILGLAEMRWTGVGGKIWWSGEPKRHERGMGFLVKKNTTSSVLVCNPVSSRKIQIRIAARPHNINIIQIYAPTSSSTEEEEEEEEEEVESFYEELEEAIENSIKRDYLLVVGDWNAQIGGDTIPDWKGVVGGYSIGATNERGQKALEFAERHKLVIANPLFKHKRLRLVTWHAPNGQS